MSLYVLAQVVRTHEGFIADLAGELLFACVDSGMPMELVGTCEPLGAIRIMASEWLLTCMPS